MKHLRVFAILMVLAVLLAACAQPIVVQQAPAAGDAGAAAACATAKESYKIGFANLTEDIVFTQLVREGMEKAAAEAGNVELVFADNKLDGATALANAENFIAQGVDGVVEFQTDEAFGNVIMAKFRENNIPVIAIDIPMPGATFFGADNYLAGQLAGAAAADWVNANWEGQVDAILMLNCRSPAPCRPPACRVCSTACRVG